MNCAVFENIIHVFDELNDAFLLKTRYTLFRSFHRLPSPFHSPDPQHWLSSCISQFSSLCFDAAKKSGLDVAVSYRVDEERHDVVSAEPSQFLTTLRMLRTYFQHGLSLTDSKDCKLRVQVQEWCSQTVGRTSDVASALSQLNFGIDGFEFAAGVVDFHLPIDAALSFVDVV